MKRYQSSSAQLGQTLHRYHTPPPLVSNMLTIQVDENIIMYHEFDYHTWRPSLKTDVFPSQIFCIFRVCWTLFPPQPYILSRSSKPCSLPIWTRPIPTPSRSIIIHHLSNALLLSMPACSPSRMPLLDPSGWSRSRSSMEAPTCSLFLYMTGTLASKHFCGPESSFQRSRVGDTVSGSCQCSSSRLWSELQE